MVADLHVHTCLSPCAEDEMSPPMMVERALAAGLDMIAVCDHNSAENAPSVRRAAEGTALAVLAGMEITSREEVHVVAIFPDDRAAAEAQAVVYRHLHGENAPEVFGEQLITDERGRVAGRNPRLLIGAADLPLAEVVGIVHQAGGVAIAAHVDRPSFSVLSQLGFFPDDVAFDAAEVCGQDTSGVPEGLPVVRSSDAHRLEDIGAGRTRLLLERRTQAEVRMAFESKDGRKVLAER